MESEESSVYGEIELLDRPDCEICGDSGMPSGEIAGTASSQTYAIMTCSSCGFIWKHAPQVRIGKLYDEDYYGGSQKDPSIDYYYELREPETCVRKKKGMGGDPSICWGQ